MNGATDADGERSATLESESTLWVLWQPATVPNDDSRVVSFLAPAAEDALALRIGRRMIRGRTAS
jgi:hypothetical protein